MAMRATAPAEQTSAGRRVPKGVRTLLVVLASVAAEAGVLRWASGRLGGRVVVRCRDGHLFTTLWIPGVSLKALRLGWWRLQRCPVGRHWTLVRAVREATLDPADLRLARSRRDAPLP